MKTIYFDYAATTKVSPTVVTAMLPYFSSEYGNPSEMHRMGFKAREAVDLSRKQIAYFLGAKSQNIIFTGSATESINLSHKGLIEALRSVQKTKLHIITSSVEHRAVLETCKHLQDLGWVKVTYLPVDKYGLVDPKLVISALRPETVLVSIIYINNEVGTAQPIKEIGRYLSEKEKIGRQRIYFHTDATQAIGYLDCNVVRLGVDFLSFTGHKIHAPKGIGVLYVKNASLLKRQVDGGGQEFGLRASTENTPYIVGLAKAIQEIGKTRRNVKKIKTLRDQLIAGVLAISGTRLTGHPTKRAPHIASFVVERAEGEAMVLRLSQEGIMISSGSACTSASLKPSHVLTAMGIPPDLSHGSLRFSLGRNTNRREIEYILAVLPKVIRQLRKMAPN